MKVIDKIQKKVKENSPLRVVKVKIIKSEKPEANARVYFYTANSGFWFDLFSRDRWKKPYKEYRKLLPDIFKRVGWGPSKVNWSQYAGCSCGCSPGFIVKGVKGLDIHVDIRRVL
jgi:hypothetical protein